MLLANGLTHTLSPHLWSLRTAVQGILNSMGLYVCVYLDSRPVEMLVFVAVTQKMV